MALSVGYVTLGCKVSQYETEAVREQMEVRGYSTRPFEEPCDVYVVNTCTVTAESDRKCRQAIRRAHKANPDAPIFVMGCYAQSAPETVLALPGVGRKSANLIMGDVFHKPAIVTDTHCIRLVNRMGLVDGIKDPKKVEMALWKLIPPEEGSDFCHRLVYHGREICTARTKPYCDKCCLNDICAQKI